MRRSYRRSEGRRTVEQNDLPASLSSGGAYDIVCCAVVGLILPGLEATTHLSQPQHNVIDRNKKMNKLFSLFFSEGSYMIVLCSRLLRSNIRTLPSAPQLTKTSTLLAQKRTSKTSLSCAIN